MARRSKAQVQFDNELKARVLDALSDPSPRGMHAVGRALVLLNQRQTTTERLCKSTQEHNNRGFTSADAFMGQNHAEFYAKKKYLTPKQLQMWREKKDDMGQYTGQPSNRIKKYWAQLVEESKLKAERLAMMAEASEAA